MRSYIHVLMDVKTKKSKGLRRRFKRKKNDERKRRAAKTNTLQPVAVNVQHQLFSFDIVQSTRTMPEWTATIEQDTTIQFYIILTIITR